MNSKQSSHTEKTQNGIQITALNQSKVQRQNQVPRSIIAFEPLHNYRLVHQFQLQHKGANNALNQQTKKDKHLLSDTFISDFIKLI